MLKIFFLVYVIFYWKANFFSKFVFCSKSHNFAKKKVVWPQKSYPRYFKRYSKDLSKEFEQKSIFDDFGEKLHFWANFWICGEHCWSHKIVGNRQTQNKISRWVQNFMENILDTTSWSNWWKLIDIFPIKAVKILGPKAWQNSTKIWTPFKESFGDINFRFGKKSKYFLKIWQIDSLYSDHCMLKKKTIPPSPSERASFI